MMRFFSIILATFLSRAAASPSGASACPAGVAAPGGPHLTGKPGLVGELSAGNYTVTVGGTPVTFDGAPVEVPLDFDIEVTAGGTVFKGILIRVGGTTADQVTTSSELVAPARACDDVGSVTHANAFPKTGGTATVSLDAATTLDVDVSIVVETGSGTATVYYSSFQLNAVGDSSTGGGGIETNETPEGNVPTSDAIVLGSGASATLAAAFALLF